MGRRSSTRVLRSTYEDALAAQLEGSGVSFGYETEAFPYVTTHKYIPDFVFYNTKILVEAKGYFTPADRGKILRARTAIEQEGWELRFVFQRANNRLSTRTKTTYADWCDRHKFAWAEGDIPREWYNG